MVLAEGWRHGAFPSGSPPLRQILLEDCIPESAACNTSLALCKELGMEGLAGVCNDLSW